MIIVDTHSHASLSRYEPVECLIHQMDSNGVSHAVLVQIGVQSNNSYQMECLRRFPGRFMSVVRVDPGDPEAPRTLESLVDQGASGIRLRVDSSLSKGPGLRLWYAAADLGIAVSCNGRPEDFASETFALLVRELSGTSIVLEHLGGSNRRPQGPVIDEITAKVFALSVYPNVYMKLTGLGEYSSFARLSGESYPFERPVPPLLEEALKRFGPSRLMWGSDHPRVSAREGYGNALRLTMEQLKEIGEAERELILARVALSVFGPPR